jgi:hypothetical protein
MRATVLAMGLFACSNVDSRSGGDAAIDSPRVLDAATDTWLDGGGPFPDAAGTNTGFTNPSAVLAAWTETSAGVFTAQTLDLSCLGMARNDAATSVTVSLAVAVRDFQSGNVVSNAQVSSFAGTASATPFAAGTTDGTGNVTLSVPTNQRRIGFRITHTNALPTLIYDRLLAPSVANQSLTLQSVSNATAATLPALIGVTRTPGTAIALATMRDCAGHTVSNFVATVSTTPTTPAHAPNAQTYYFDDQVGLPVRHTSAPQGTRNGLFMVIDVPPLTTAYLQVWGFRNASELAAQTMTRVAELAVPFTADSVVTVTHEPSATN